MSHLRRGCYLLSKISYSRAFLRAKVPESCFGLKAIRYSFYPKPLIERFCSTATQPAWRNTTNKPYSYGYVVTAYKSYEDIENELNDIEKRGRVSEFQVKRVLEKCGYQMYKTSSETRDLLFKRAWTIFTKSCAFKPGPSVHEQALETKLENFVYVCAYDYLQSLKSDNILVSEAILLLLAIHSADRGDFDGARSLLDDVDINGNSDPKMLLLLCMAYARIGDEKAVQSLCQQVEDAYGRPSVQFYTRVAYNYALCGNEKGVLDTLERAKQKEVKVATSYCRAYVGFVIGGYKEEAKQILRKISSEKQLNGYKMVQVHSLLGENYVEEAWELFNTTTNAKNHFSLMLAGHERLGEATLRYLNANEFWILLFTNQINLEQKLKVVAALDKERLPRTISISEMTCAEIKRHCLRLSIEETVEVLKALKSVKFVTEESKMTVAYIIWQYLRQRLPVQDASFSLQKCGFEVPAEWTTVKQHHRERPNRGVSVRASVRENKQARSSQKSDIYLSLKELVLKLGGVPKQSSEMAEALGKLIKVGESAEDILHKLQKSLFDEDLMRTHLLLLCLAKGEVKQCVKLAEKNFQQYDGFQEAFAQAVRTSFENANPMDTCSMMWCIARRCKNPKETVVRLLNDKVTLSDNMRSDLKRELHEMERKTLEIQSQLNLLSGIKHELEGESVSERSAPLKTNHVEELMECIRKGDVRKFWEKKKEMTTNGMEIGSKVFSAFVHAFQVDQFQEVRSLIKQLADEGSVESLLGERHRFKRATSQYINFSKTSVMYNSSGDMADYLRNGIIRPADLTVQLFDLFAKKRKRDFEKLEQYLLSRTAKSEFAAPLRNLVYHYALSDQVEKASELAKTCQTNYQVQFVVTTCLRSINEKGLRNFLRIIQDANLTDEKRKDYVGKLYGGLILLQCKQIQYEGAVSVYNEAVNDGVSESIPTNILLQLETQLKEMGQPLPWKEGAVLQRLNQQELDFEDSDDESHPGQESVKNNKKSGKHGEIETAKSKKIETEANEEIETVNTEKMETASIEGMEIVNSENLETEASETMETTESEKLETDTLEEIGNLQSEKLETAPGEELEPADGEKIETGANEEMETMKSEKLETGSSEKDLEKA